MERWAHRLRVIEALAWIALATVALRLVPWRRSSWLFGRCEPAAAGDGLPDRGWTVEEMRLARKTAAAVRRAAHWSPLPALCLVQALALRAMLARRGLRGRLHLSAGSGGGALAAHAWVSLGGETVLGGGAPRGQVELARFP